VLHLRPQPGVLRAQPGQLLGRRGLEDAHAVPPEVSSRTCATSPATEKGLAR
jgi:hypothetical protein